MVADLVRLALAPEEQAGKIIASVKSRYSPEQFQEGFKAVGLLFEHLARVVSPGPSDEEPTPNKGELLMFGNLTCNMACSFRVPSILRSRLTTLIATT